MTQKSNYGGQSQYSNGGGVVPLFNTTKNKENMMDKFKSPIRDDISKRTGTVNQTLKSELNQFLG